MEEPARPLPWRVVALFYVVLTLVFLPWVLAADEKAVPTFFWLLAAIVLPTPMKVLLRRWGYDVDPNRWTWRA